MLKNIAIVRHGDWGRDYHNLGGDGTDGTQGLVEALTEQLKRYVGGTSISLLTSRGGKARETAAVIGRLLEVDYVIVNELADRDDEEHRALILRQTTETVILVTHEPVVQNLPVALLMDNGMPMPAQDVLHGNTEGSLLIINGRNMILKPLSGRTGNGGQ